MTLYPCESLSSHSVTKSALMTFTVSAALKAALITPLCALAFLIALMGALALPNGPIAKHILQDFTVVATDRAHNGHKMDAFTECVGLGVGHFDKGETTLLQSSIRARTTYGCSNLHTFLETGVDKNSWDYYRYWHGHTVVTRPFLSILPYNNFRGLVFNFSLALFALLCWRVGERLGANAGLAFAAPFLFLNMLAFWPVATKAVTWWLAAGGALYFTKPRRWGETTLIVFFILGALTAFFDFLTTPMLIFTLPVFVFFLMSPRTDPVWEKPLRNLFLCFAFWFAGYAGLWATKVIFAGIVIGPDAFNNVIGAIQIRLQGEGPGVDRFTPGAALLDNFLSLKGLWAPLTLIVFGVLPFIKRHKRAVFKRLKNETPVFLCIAAMPLLWLELLSNHSQIHAGFTHINFAPLLILLGLVLFDNGRAMLESPKAKPTGSGAPPLQ